MNKNEDYDELVIEDLKNVKKGKRTRFMNKLQRWSYPKVINKLERLSEEEGFTLTKINPAYTSQTCSKCGSTDSKSRNGENFECVKCKNKIDADFNAAINILHRGNYNSSATKKNSNLIKKSTTIVDNYKFL